MTRTVLFTLCILFSSFGKAQDSLATDSSKHKKVFKREDYIEDLTYMINVAPVISKSDRGFTISGNRDIQYTPNEGGTIGLKLQHRWLGFTVAYAPRKLQDENIGQSEFLNIILNSYGKKIGFDAYFLSYRGYYIQNLKSLEKVSTPEEEANNPYRYRYDLKTINTGFNVYYIFNSKKLSYRSSFVQNEWQKKSAGSFMLTSSFNFYRINADSTVVPERYDSIAEEFGRLKSGNFYSFAVMPGYAYTLVVFKRLFLTLSPSLGLMLQEQSYSTEHDYKVNRVALFPRFLGRAGLGFNSKRFYCGLSSVTDVYNIRLDKDVQINNLLNSFTLYLGIRLGVPKSMKKGSDVIDKYDPGKLISKPFQKKN